VPDLGYHFTGWTGDYVGSNDPLTITNVTADLTITAQLRARHAHGDVRRRGARLADRHDPQTVNYGSNCTPVTPVPDLGYHFTGWTGDYVGSNNPLTITNVTADLTITANFAIDTHTVTFVGRRARLLTGTTPQTVNYGSNCTPVTPVPDLGYPLHRLDRRLRRQQRPPDDHQRHRRPDHHRQLRARHAHGDVRRRGARPR